MIFEEIGLAQVDGSVQCPKIQVDGKIYLIGLKDLQRGLADNSLIQVMQIAEKSEQEPSIPDAPTTPTTENKSLSWGNTP